MNQAETVEPGHIPKRFPACVGHAAGIQGVDVWREKERERKRGREGEGKGEGEEEGKEILLVFDLVQGAQSCSWSILLDTNAILNRNANTSIESIWKYYVCETVFWMM